MPTTSSTATASAKPSSTPISISPSGEPASGKISSTSTANVGTGAPAGSPKPSASTPSPTKSPSPSPSNSKSVLSSSASSGSIASVSASRSSGSSVSNIALVPGSLTTNIASTSIGTSPDGQRFTTVFSTDAVITNPTSSSTAALSAAGDDKVNNIGLIVGICIGGVAFLGISGVVLFWLYKRLKNGSNFYSDANSRTNLTAGTRNGVNLKSFDGSFDPGRFVVERKPVPEEYLSVIPDMYQGSVGYHGGLSAEEGADGGSTAVGSLSAGNGAGVAPAAGAGVGEVLGSISGSRPESPPQTQPQYHYQKAIRHSPSYPGGNLIPTVPVSVPPSAPGLNRQNSQEGYHYARSPSASPPPHKLGGQYALMPAPHVPNAYVNPLGISVVPQGEESPPSTASPGKRENSTARLSFPYNSYAPPSSTAHARPTTAPTTTTAPHPFAVRERRRSSQLADSRTSVDLALAMGMGVSGKSSPSLNANANPNPTPSPRRYSFSTSRTRSHSREQPHSRTPQDDGSAGEEGSEGDDDDERLYYRGPPAPAASTSSPPERGERHPHHSLINAAGLQASESQSQLQSQSQSQPPHPPSSYSKTSPPPTPPYATTATPFIRREPSLASGITAGSNVNSKIAARNRSNVSLNQRRAGSAISSGIEASVGVVVPEPRNW